DDAARHEERRDLLRAPRLGVLLIILFDRVEAADAGAHRDADARAILLRDLNARILQRVGRGRETVVHEGVHLPQILRGEILFGLESLYRTAEANRNRAYVETSDRADTALAGQDIFPCGLARTADRSADAEPSHDDASRRQALTSLIELGRASCREW